MFPIKKTNANHILLDYIKQLFTYLRLILKGFYLLVMYNLHTLSKMSRLVYFCNRMERVEIGVGIKLLISKVHLVLSVHLTPEQWTFLIKLNTFHQELWKFVPQ